MRHLQADPQVSQRALASAMGLSVGSINYCLKALIAKGWVKIENFSNSADKLAYAYVLTPMGLAEKAALTLRFWERKQAEYEALRAEMAALSEELNRQRAEPAAHAQRPEPGAPR